MEHTLKELFQLAAVYARSGCGSCSAFLSLEGGRVLPLCIGFWLHQRKHGYCHSK